MNVVVGVVVGVGIYVGYKFGKKSQPLIINISGRIIDDSGSTPIREGHV